MYPIKKVNNEFVPSEGSRLNYTNNLPIRDGLINSTPNHSERISYSPERVNLFNTIVQNSANQTNSLFNNSLMQKNQHERTNQIEEILLNKSFLKIDHLENVLKTEKATFKSKSNQVINHFEALLNKTQNLKTQAEREDELMLNRFAELKQQIKDMQANFHTDFNARLDNLMRNPNTLKSSYTNTENLENKLDRVDETDSCTKTNKNNQNTKILKNKVNDKNK